MEITKVDIVCLFPIGIGKVRKIDLKYLKVEFIVKNPLYIK